MKSNTDASFVGLDELKRKQKRQLDDFERWAASGYWQAFHENHYDW
jgi:hypothetical protein